MHRTPVSLIGLLMLAGAASASQPGTVEGTTTTEGGALLNGMCGVLYNAKGTVELIDFAGTGTDGNKGHYIQENVPVGHYRLLFVNCGANTDGQSPDFHFTPVFYGSTWNVKDSSLVTVTSGNTTALGPQQIPYGGFVVGTVTDQTIHAPADTPPVGFVPPGGSKFFLSFAWTIVCGNPDGSYSSNSGFQQGVPSGSKVIFAPGGWGCGDSQGNFNAGKWVQKGKTPAIVVGGQVMQNADLEETGSQLGYPSHPMQSQIRLHVARHVLFFPAD